MAYSLYVFSVTSELLILLVWSSSFLQFDLVVVCFGDFVVQLLDLPALRDDFLCCQAVFEVLSRAAIGEGRFVGTHCVYPCGYLWLSPA